MEYAIAFQVLCGCFSAFVARRKNRDPVAWWFIGALLPVAGVVISVTVAPRPPQAGRPGVRKAPPRRPSRCTREYTPVCPGCPFFRRSLFEAEAGENKKGYCAHYGKDLVSDSEPKQPGVIIEDD